MSNPVVFFDMTIGGAPAGRIEMTLRADVVPKTAEVRAQAQACALVPRLHMPPSQLRDRKPYRARLAKPAAASDAAGRRSLSHPEPVLCIHPRHV